MKTKVLIVFAFLFGLVVNANSQVLKKTTLQYADLYAVTTDGQYYYAVGDVNYPGNQKLVQGLVVKLDKDLNIIWRKELGNALIDRFRDVYVLDGKIYAFGTTWRPKNEQRKSDVWMVVLDQDGNIQLEKHFGGAGQDGLTHVNLANNGNFLLAGYYSFNGNDRNFWILEVTPQGQIVWDKRFGTASKYEKANRVYQLKDGYLLLGTVLPPGKKDVDAWVIRLNNSKNIVWSRNYNLKEDNYFHTCIIEPSKFILIGNAAPEMKSKKGDLWFMTVTDNGQKIQDKKIGTYKRDWSQNAIYENGKIYVFGSQGAENTAAIWTISTTGDLLNTKTFPLPGIMDGIYDNGAFVIAGGMKQNGYVAIVK